LQNPKDKRQIIPDARMKTIFGSKPFQGFSMMTALSKHIDVDKDS
jgi:chromatin remodeling complex protein RSC6